VPWTIVPYWSIDLLYGLSLFICSSRRELDMHAKRLLAAQLIALPGFLLVPLRFTFERPDIDGLFGWLFDVLMGFDKPFNQAPSLHIALLVILWVRYAAHVHGLWAWLLHVWFALIGLSVLTTWQHHFIDVPAGLWAGLLCLALFPEHQSTPLRLLPPDRQRLKLALYYGLGGAALALSATLAGGAGWLLLWPAGALGLVSAIYLSGDPALFRKHQGRIQPAARWLLAPYLAGARLNSRIWTRRHPEPDEISDGVWLGRIPDRCGRVQRPPFASIVDLSAELPLDIRGLAYRHIAVLDLTVPDVEQIERAATTITELQDQRPTLVCCALGYSRSALAVAAWLLASGRAPSIDDALALIRLARPQIVLGDRHRQRLAEWSTRTATG
jgi:membrane-associated phospholipid phosphatase